MIYLMLDARTLQTAFDRNLNLLIDHIKQNQVLI